MYKDKDRQREAVRIAVRRHREKVKGITKGITVIPKICNTHNVIPVIPKTANEIIMPRRKGASTVQHHPACKCYACKKT